MDMSARGRFAAMKAAINSQQPGSRSLSVGRCARSFLLAGTLSFARVLGGVAPFGMAFVGAHVQGAEGAAALLGALAGYLLGGDIGWGIRYLAGTVLLYTLVFLCRSLPFSRSALFAPLCAAAVMALTGFLGSYSLSGASKFDAAQLLLESTLAFGSCYFFREALSVSARLTEHDELRHSVSLTILLSCGLMAFAPLELFGTLSLGRALAEVVVMASALKGGMFTGAAAGTVLGLAMDIAAGGAPFYTMAYAFSALLAGVFSKHGRLLFTLAFVLTCGVAVGCEWSESVYLSLLYETFVASVLFIILPTPAVSALGMLLHDNSPGSGERGLRRFVAGKVRDLSEAYGQLFEIVEKNLTEPCNDGDIAKVFDRAADAVCVNCRSKNECWNRSYMDTLSALNDATRAMLANGTLTLDDLPGYFRGKCLAPKDFVDAVNRELRALSYRRQLKACLHENRAVAWGQYADMARMLATVARELGSVNGTDAPAEKRLVRYLRSLDIDAEVSVYRDALGRLRATIESPALPLLQRHEDYLQKLSEVLGVRLCLPQGGNKAKARLTLLEAEPLAVSVGIAAMKKRGEKVSGDRGSYFKTDAGVLYVILSDGMGTGDEAAKDSAQVIEILEKFLRSGADGAMAMKVLNSALLLRGADNWGFATVDLMSIDLFSGETCFYKYGAAPSYVKNGKSIRRIAGESLAAGLSLGDGTAPDTVKMQLQSGSTALIASDGVISTGDDAWIREMLARGFTDMKALAKCTLKEAETRYGSEDDMTVLAVRLEERRA